MQPKFHRRPNRLPLIHLVLKKLRGRGWFSAQSVSLATYFGQGIPHRQQRRRVRDTLEAYVAAGVLERYDGAACCLFRHREILKPEQFNLEMMRGFEEHARSCHLPAKDLTLQLIDHALDVLVPRDADPAAFLADGSVMRRLDGVSRPDEPADRGQIPARDRDFETNENIFPGGTFAPQIKT